VKQTGGAQIWASESAADLFRTLRQSKALWWQMSYISGPTHVHKRVRTYAHKQVKGVKLLALFPFL
jgi:hypothetical protein